MPVPVFGNLTFKSLSTGTQLCGVTTLGEAYCEGGPQEDPWIRGKVPGELQFASISAPHGSHTCGVTVNGDAYCWGINNDGQLGNSSTNHSTTPVRVTGLRFKSISVWKGYTCGVTLSDEAYCWGHNDDGQLGNGSQTKSLVPVRVSGGLHFTSVHCGSAMTCGLATDGALYCWGHESGFIGHKGSAYPVRVAF